MNRLWIFTKQSGGGSITLNNHGIITQECPVWRNFHNKHVSLLFRTLRSHTNLEVKSL